MHSSTFGENQTKEYQHKHVMKTVKHGGGGVEIWGYLQLQDLDNLQSLNAHNDPKYIIPQQNGQ